VVSEPVGSCHQDLAKSVHHDVADREHPDLPHHTIDLSADNFSLLLEVRVGSDGLLRLLLLRVDHLDLDCSVEHYASFRLMILIITFVNSATLWGNIPAGNF